MNRRQRPQTRSAQSLLVPLILANAGVLVVFLSGPNAQHPIVPLAYGGAAVAVAGAVALVRALAVRRRDTGSRNASER